jgi:hypothetical protein
LPYLFGTDIDTIPQNIPYIISDKSLVEKWSKILDRSGSSYLKVGLAWAGKPTHKRDRYRSFPLSLYAPLAGYQDIIFYSLQKGAGEEESMNPPAGMKLIDFTRELSDFSDTAALIANLDLVISADTAVAHLAGAMGKPVWTLLPYAPDWRWLLGRSATPWYPTMKLFRQNEPQGWKSVIQHVVDSLAEYK